MKKVILWIFIVLITFISIYNIIHRKKWDFDTTYVKLVLEIDSFLSENNETNLKILQKFVALGIKCVSYSYKENDLSFSTIKNHFPEIILKLSPEKKYEFDKLDRFIKEYKDSFISVVVPVQKYKFHYDTYKIWRTFFFSDLVSLIQNNNLKWINFEFDEFFSGQKVKTDNIVRGFVIDLNLYPERYELKVKKAVKERSCKIVYIIPAEFLSLEENISRIKNIFRTISSSSGNFNIVKFHSINLESIAYWITIFIAIFVPSMVYKIVLKGTFNSENKITNFFKINFITIFFGILCYGIMQNYDFVSLNNHLLGVKAIFVLPLIISMFTIFSKEELKKIFNYNVKFRDVIFIFFGFLVLYYIILRLGIVSEKIVPGVELKFREKIESIILFRPRFKEIFFAQPMLIFSLFLIKEKKFIGKILLWSSVIGQVSIMNTFLHFHTPIELSLARTFVGLFGGMVIGLVIVIMYKAAVRVV